MTKRRVGRPSTYTEKVGQRICELLADGEPITRICKRVGVRYETVMRWTSRHPEFGESFARARNIGLALMAEGILELSQDDTRDPRHKQLEIDARKWILAKMMPKVFGDKKTVEMHSTIDERRKMTPVEMSTRVQALIREAEARTGSEEDGDE